MRELTAAPEPSRLTECARQALTQAAPSGVIVSIAPDGPGFTVVLDSSSTASICRQAWLRSGYQVRPAPAGFLLAALGAAGERPAGAVRLRVEPPALLPDGPDRPTRLSDQELHELRRRAAREAGPFVDPFIVSKPGPRFHSREWAKAVLGFELREMDWPTEYLLHIAMLAEPDPPITPAQAVEQQQREEHARQAESTRAALVERHHQAEQDAARWRAVLAGCAVPVTVRENLKGSQRIRGGRSIGRLRHVVPEVNAVSDRRVHPAGRALCEKTRERLLGDPTGEHATCTSCVTYTARIRAADPT